MADLSKAAARGVASALERPGQGPRGHELLVFPAPFDEKDLSPTSPVTIANKIVAYVPEGIDPWQVANSARFALEQRLSELSRAVFAKVGEGDPQRSSHVDLNRAKAQLEELIEMIWVAVPMIDESAFGDARARLDRLLGARKALHAWKQPGWWSEDGSRKSSLDGLRDSVLDECLFDGAFDSVQRRRWYDVHGSERLCGVGLLKRFGRRALREMVPSVVVPVPSTNHLAALPSLRGLDRIAQNDSEVASHWARYRATLEHAGIAEEFREAPAELQSKLLGSYDGGVLFPGRVHDALLEVGADDATRQRVEHARRELLRKARIEEPAAYYGILVADGDSMGTLIKAQRTRSEQRSLSRALGAFAKLVPDLVQRHEGALIYAGGDDVLALLPLHRALEAAAAIAKAFRAERASWAELRPSLSAGLAIVHAWSPLEQGLRAARDAEKYAKQQKGKGALAIAVHKRSGEPVIVRGALDPFVDELQQIIEWQMNNELPGTIIHELISLERLQRDVEAPEQQERIRAIQLAEARRILKRKGLEQEIYAALERTFERGEVDAVMLGRAFAVARVFARAKLAAGGGAP